MTGKRRKGWGQTRKRRKFQQKTGQPKSTPVTIRFVKPQPREGKS